MSDRPYTDDDLRAEAARQITAHSRRQNRGETYAAMLDARIESTRTADGAASWSEALDPDELVTPAEAVNGLIEGAADVSEWAVSLGTDGLEPTGHTLQLGVDPGEGDRPRVRLHFAFHPDMTDADRDSFVFGLSKAILRNL